MDLLPLAFDHGNGLESRDFLADARKRDQLLPDPFPAMQWPLATIGYGIGG
jgi:hypothetical protein